MLGANGETRNDCHNLLAHTVLGKASPGSADQSRDGFHAFAAARRLADARPDEGVDKQTASPVCRNSVPAQKSGLSATGM
jgi:hypothetical protein